jgi:signal transduction histidine kinase
MTEPMDTAQDLLARLKSTEDENERLRTAMCEAIHVVECVRRFISGAESVDVLADLLKHTTRLLGIGDAGIITLYNEEEGCDEVIATYNHDWRVLSTIHLRPGQGATGWVYNTQMPRIYNGIDGVASCLDGVEPDKRNTILQSDGRLSSSLICSPLMGRGKVVGVIQIENYGDERQFGEKELDLLSNLVASPLAIALENTGLSALMVHANHQVRDLLSQTVRARDDERARIARDLHDKISQTLASMHIGLLNFRSFAARSEEGAQMLDYIQELDDELQRTIKTTQDLTIDLRPAVLNDCNLIEALRRYMALRIEKAGIQTDVRCDGIDVASLENWLATTLFFVAQEALSNVVRHSGATTVKLRLYCEGNNIVLVIVDDGHGFTTNCYDECSLSLGIQGMEERVAVLGGDLQISSELGLGTTVRARIPRLHE